MGGSENHTALSIGDAILAKPTLPQLECGVGYRVIVACDEVSKGGRWSIRAVVAGQAGEVDDATRQLGGTVATGGSYLPGNLWRTHQPKPKHKYEQVHGKEKAKEDKVGDN